jgi:hypothetical protein
MIVKTHDVFCDEGGNDCLGWCVQASCTDSQGGAREARKMARGVGWKRVDGRDLCPNCQKEQA